MVAVTSDMLRDGVWRIRNGNAPYRLARLLSDVIIGVGTQAVHLFQRCAAVIDVRLL
jgi:hypothetical protein